MLVPGENVLERPRAEPALKRSRVSKTGRSALSSSSSKNFMSLGIPCDEGRCPRKCSINISCNRRQEILNEYRSMDNEERKVWVFNSVRRGLKRKNTTGPGHVSRRHMTYSYHLEGEDGGEYDVCKTFFLATLGYHPRNDKVIMTVLRAPSCESIALSRDRRGRHVPSNKLDTNAIKAHVDSFGPTVSNCEEGCTRNWRCPSSSHISIRRMYRNFIEKNPGFKCSYETYRKVVNEHKAQRGKMLSD